MAQTTSEQSVDGMVGPRIFGGRWRIGWLGLQERMLSRMDRLATRWHGTRGKTAHLDTGVRGEVAAMFELRRQGYIVIARRWTTGTLRGDVDLIAWDGEALCFIEVKTRSVRTMYPADKAVDEVKKRTLRSLARAYLKPYERGGERVNYRFDVVSVYLAGRAGEGASASQRVEDGSAEVVEIVQHAFSNA